MRVAVLMTVHNRADLTLQCLDSLASQRLDAGQYLDVFVVDDGSTDGTAARIHDEHPYVTVIAGSGSLFWSAGMAAAQVTATPSDPDCVLWLNDDVDLAPSSIATAISLLQSRLEPTIVVGATTEPGTGAITYTGAIRASKRPGNLRPLAPNGKPQRIDTFNGNFVLVPRSIYTTVGTVSSHFEHAYGDIDYGLRAQAAGFAAVLMPEPVGTCASNPPNGDWRHAAQPRLRRIQLLFSRKGYPVKSHLRYQREHGGWRWPMYFAASYISGLFKIAIGR